jgi:hypothetical protein
MQATVILYAPCARGTTRAIADAIFVAAAIVQAALIVLAAAISAEQASGTTLAGDTGCTVLTAHIAAGVILRAAGSPYAGIAFSAAGIAANRLVRAASITRADL